MVTRPGLAGGISRFRAASGGEVGQAGGAERGDPRNGPTGLAAPRSGGRLLHKVAVPATRIQTIWGTAWAPLPGLPSDWCVGGERNPLFPNRGPCDETQRTRHPAGQTPNGFRPPRAPGPAAMGRVLRPPTGSAPVPIGPGNGVQSSTGPAQRDGGQSRAGAGGGGGVTHGCRGWAKSSSRCSVWRSASAPAVRLHSTAQSGATRSLRPRSPWAGSCGSGGRGGGGAQPGACISSRCRLSLILKRKENENENSGAPPPPPNLGVSGQVEF